ncbi:MAG: phage tail protein [Planctomycetota bacterium]
MKVDRLKSYRFSTEAQWNACLLVQADHDSLRKKKVVRPFAPYARPGTLHKSGGAHAPVVTSTGQILWRDDHCAVHRLSGCDDVPETFAAPFAIAHATRIVATSSDLWVIGDPPETLQRYEADTLTRLLIVDLPNAPVIDIANRGHDSVLALVESDGVWRSVRLSRSGQVVATIEFKGVSHVEAFVFLQRAQKFVVLTGGPHSRLYWFSAEGGSAHFSLAVAAMRPCFQARVLGGDSSDRVFLAGADGGEFGRAYVVIFDADGNALGELPLDPQDAPATGITASRDTLLVTGPRGLLQFKAAELVPEGAGQVQCNLLTPSLFSPDRENQRRWLRIEATAHLPHGSSLEISWAATDDTTTRDRLVAIAKDDTSPASHRIATLLNEPDLRRGRTVFHGAGSEPQSVKSFTAKLFDINERYLWVGLTLTATTGASLPILTELAVLYHGRTLMEDLPAIYQREEERPNNFLRALVGVLETTTQGLDARIGSLGSQVHPSTAQELWLNFIARWLGVPWDDALTPQQKREIVLRASDLAKWRGTRAGLEALLESLIPGLPRRFRVTDATADFGFAVVGGESCPGSALPAMLGGRTQWHSELDSNAVLGSMRLPCAGQLEDGAWHLAGKVRVDVAATAAEKRAWEPWLLALITEMVPLMARVELRWVTSQALRTDRLDGTMTLESAPTPHLGTDAITGQARLPERSPRLSTAGPIIDTRLR